MADDYVVPVIEGNNKPNNTNTTSTKKYFKKIDSVSAQTLLEKAMLDSQFAGKLSPKIIAEFIDDFNEESEKQARTIAATIQSRLKPGATPEEIAQATQNAITTEFPSYFSATAFSKTFIWKKINFKDKTAGANAVKALQDIKDLAGAYGPNDMPDVMLEDYALQVAKGALTLDDFKGIMQKTAVKNYPQFADALGRNPNWTMYDMAQPYIDTMAKRLGVPRESIKLNNKLLDKALRPDGSAGKLPAQSIGDFDLAVMNSEDYQWSPEANETARGLATSLGSAMEMGI